MLDNNISVIKSNDLKCCSYNNWYKQFEKITPESDLLKIPDNVLEYLRDEIIMLPKECFITKTNTQEIYSNFLNDDTIIYEPPEFIDFSNKIKNILNKYNNKVFLKTNWHCPRDAIWIKTGQTLCCNDITDVYQLLKASSLCKNDLNEFDKNIFNYYLIFKKFIDIHPGCEFRCFVKNNNLIAISPRDWPQYHSHFSTDKLDIINDIVTLFKEKIKEKFTLKTFVFDVVRESKDNVYLLDITLFNEKFTDSLAYEWNDLNTNIEYIDNIDEPEFRYLSSDCGIQPTKRNNYGIPYDIVNMFQATNTDNSNINDLLQNMTIQENLYNLNNDED